MYLVFLFTTLYFGSRIVAKGPNLTLPIPGQIAEAIVNTELAQHERDRRPTEAQQ
jgi:cytochrome d ubiquinol oxidase subunit I